MIKVAITGSFDPPHAGHKFLVDTCKKLGFEPLVVVANNEDKNYKKSLSDRVSGCLDYLGCRVIGCDSSNIGGRIKSEGCRFIVRGVRDCVDLEYESAVTEYNRNVNEIETIYIPTTELLKDYRSSNMK